MISNDREGFILFEETGRCCKTIERIISFTILTDKSGESERGVVTSDDTSSVNLGNVDLDGSMVLGVDETTSSRAKYFI
jgi:hypothetical protein